MHLSLDEIDKVYIIGIKGAGIVSFAEIFHAKGKTVVGSDTDETFFTDETLKNLGIIFYEGFDEKNIRNENPIDLVIHSTVYTEKNNPEIRYAKKKGMKIISFPELIGIFMKEKYGIAICGTHGKTTTTAMLTLAMKAAGADPTAIIGSKVEQLKSNIALGSSQYFVIEADEYQNKLSMYNPLGVVLTSIDFDHPDYFEDFEEYKKVFVAFVEKIPAHGFLIAWGESADVVKIARHAKCRVIFYGLFLEDRLLDTLKEECEGMNVGYIKTPTNFELSVPGKHNLLNATAALAVCDQLKLKRAEALDALAKYRGSERRFELKGEKNGALVIDDYAHHPEEIKATLLAAKERYPGRNIICVFHPHTFSRTAALLSEFSQSFSKADEVIVLDIYSSAREKVGEVHSRDLVEKIKKFQSQVEYIPTIEEAYSYLHDKIDENDIIITMGAGNVWELGTMLVQGKIM